MSEELIRTIAMEVVNQSILGNYRIYLLIIAVSIISVSISVFVSSYLKQRGKQYATKADFEKILNQLKETTRITEEIKSDIHAKSQDDINIKLLVREKLESIFFSNIRVRAMA